MAAFAHKKHKKLERLPTTMRFMAKGNPCAHSPAAKRSRVPNVYRLCRFGTFVHTSSNHDIAG